MARAITISKSQTTIYVILPTNMGAIKNIDIDGTVTTYTDEFVANGNISLARAQKKAEAHFSSKNVMVSGVLSASSSDEKLTMDSDTFITNSSVCEDGVTYGHDFITREVKTTQIHYMTLIDGVPATGYITYPDVTTPSKLLNYVRREVSPNAIVLDHSIVVERRYMPVSQFETLAR